MLSVSGDFSWSPVRIVMEYLDGKLLNTEVMSEKEAKTFPGNTPVEKIVSYVKQIKNYNQRLSTPYRDE